MLVPLRNASGEITHVIPSAVEISSRKRAETELKNSKERLELAQAATNVGIFDWDVINDTSVCSPEWMHVYGFPEDETPTHAKWLDAVHPEDRAVARRRALEAVAIGEKYNDEFRVVWPDGSVHWVSSFGKTLFKDGKPWRFIGTALDVTAHKEADVALRQSEERFRTVVEAVPGLVFLTDKEGRNIFTNKSFERYTGLSESELLGDKWKSIVHHADLERNIEHWNLCVLQRKPYEIEHRLRRWDGVFRWMLTRGVPLHDEAGEIQRWLGICTDIEDHKRVEQVLRQTVENLEQYAYVASHDLQEPLRTISAFTQILERKYKSQLDEAADKYTHFIVNAANRMQHLIEDLLTYSRATSDKERLVESVDLNAVFDEVINTLDSRIAETRALISCDRLPVVLGDKGGLGQVIQNLLANAIKYCQPDIPPVISIRVERRSTDWCFTVSDNGIGFSPEHSERIFGIFKRLHGTDVPGTGIGLAIVKTIIERHGGHIWATSEGVNEGAAFSFTLP
jgi:PAS domain S-box-containing protein